MRRRVLLLVLIVAALVATPSAAAADRVMDLDGVPNPAELVTRTLDGQIIARLSPPVFEWFTPLADGGAVVSASDLGIWIVHPDSTAVRVSTMSAREFSAPADGRKVAFAHESAGRSEIYVVNRDGSGLRRLTGQPGTWNSNPRFSPDGSTIAYECGPALDSAPDAGACGPQLDGAFWPSGIMLMNADGSNKRLVLESSPPFAPYFSVPWYLAREGGTLGLQGWSPNARRLLLASPRLLPLNNYSSIPVSQLFTIKADGSDLFGDGIQAPLLDTINRPNPLDIFQASFSPDGRQILFGATDAAELWVLVQHAYVVDAGGRYLQPLPAFNPTAAFVPSAVGASPPPTIDATHIVLPWTRGLSTQTARKRLEARHLEVLTTAVFSSTIRRGRVVSMSPRAGTRVHKAGWNDVVDVTLYISRGSRRTAP